MQRLVAVQAQDYSGSKWGLGLRCHGATDSSVEAAYNDGRILRTHALRPTWHFVVADDIRWLLSLTGPRVLNASAAMFRRMELDGPVLSRSMKVIQKALEAGDCTRDELRAPLEDAGVNTKGDLRMSYILIHAELNALVCSGPRRGNQFTYALLDTRAPGARTLDADAATAELARRYYHTRGPASVHDFAKWAGLTLKSSRAGLESCKSELERHLVDGEEQWTPPSSLGKTQKNTAYLVSIYDEYVSSYRKRSAMAPESLTPQLIAMGNALTGIVLVDGRIVGTWKRTIRKNSIEMAIGALERLTGAARTAITANAEEYAQFFGSTATVGITG